MIHVVEQVLNGVQFGVMLFLMAAGLTLIFGIMNLINLAHGSLYMVGAYVAAAVFAATGSFLLGLGAALGAAIIVGTAIEIVVFRRLYGRDHLDQVLATFGLILFFNEMVRILFGSTALYMHVADAGVGAGRKKHQPPIVKTGQAQENRAEPQTRTNASDEEPVEGESSRKTCNR